MDTDQQVTAQSSSAHRTPNVQQAHLESILLCQSKVLVPQRVSGQTVFPLPSLNVPMQHTGAADAQTTQASLQILPMVCLSLKISAEQHSSEAQSNLICD